MFDDFIEAFDATHGDMGCNPDAASLGVFDGSDIGVPEENWGGANGEIVENHSFESGHQRVSFGRSLDDILTDVEQMKQETRTAIESLGEEASIEKQIERGAERFRDMRASIEDGIDNSLRALDELEEKYPEDWQARAQHSLDSEARHREAQEYLEHALQEKRETDHKLEFNLTDDQYKAIKDGYHQVYPQSHTYRFPDGDGNWFERDGNLYRLEENGTMTLRNENWREEIHKAETRDQRKIDDWMRQI